MNSVAGDKHCISVYKVVTCVTIQISVTNVAFQIQNLRFAYKSCISITNIKFLVTNIASRFTKWHLAL